MACAAVGRWSIPWNTFISKAERITIVNRANNFHFLRIAFYSAAHATFGYMSGLLLHTFTSIYPNTFAFIELQLSLDENLGLRMHEIPVHGQKWTMLCKKTGACSVLFGTTVLKSVSKFSDLISADVLQYCSSVSLLTEEWQSETQIQQNTRSEHAAFQGCPVSAAICIPYVIQTAGAV